MEHLSANLTDSQIEAIIKHRTAGSEETFASFNITMAEELAKIRKQTMMVSNAALD